MHTGGIVFSTILGLGVLSGIGTYFVERRTSKISRGGGELCIPVPEPDTLLGLIITGPLLFVGSVGLIICTILQV